MNRSILRMSLAVALCAALVVVAALAPSILISHRAPISDSILDTSVALIGSMIAILEFGRYRRSASVYELLLAIAVLLFAWVHSFFDLVAVLSVPHLMNAALAQRIETWGTVVTRVLAGWYLVWASVRALQRPCFVKKWHRLKFVVGLPAVIAVLSVVLLVVLVPVAHRGLLDGIAWPQSIASLIQLIGAPLFVVAAWRLSSQAHARSDVFQGWIATGCVFAGFSMFSSALLSAHGIYWVNPSDLLRETAVGTWVLGAVTEIRLYWSTMIESSRREALRKAALDLHDGLAQELALLNSFLYAPPEERTEALWHKQLQAIARRALSDARRTIATLAGDATLPIEVDLTSVVDAFARDVDVRVEVDHSLVAGVDDPARQEAIVRIVREAVTNAIRHGQAGHISIHVSIENGGTALRVSDDGIGFDHTVTSTLGRFGLVSMSEKAKEVGASFDVHSVPGLGTTVEVVWR